MKRNETETQKEARLSAFERGLRPVKREKIAKERYKTFTVSLVILLKQN